MEPERLRRDDRPCISPMGSQTTVRSRIGEMTLDQTFKNREELNQHVVSVLAQAGEQWGIVCTRYEVKDIDPPVSIMQAMKAEAEAERKKRAIILESEGFRQSAINKAEGEKAAAVLASEAQRDAAVNGESTNLPFHLPFIIPSPSLPPSLHHPFIIPSPSLPLPLTTPSPSLHHPSREAHASAPPQSPLTPRWCSGKRRCRCRKVGLPRRGREDPRDLGGESQCHRGRRACASA